MATAVESGLGDGTSAWMTVPMEPPGRAGLWAEFAGFWVCDGGVGGQDTVGRVSTAGGVG